MTTGCFDREKLPAPIAWNPWFARTICHTIKFEATICSYVGKFKTIHDAHVLVSIHTTLRIQMDYNERDHKKPYHGYNDGAWY